mmetsp:Transcript_15746/g.47233  ORF Transcript_15746/g.47233 Transcript_15746/m.47233 type:complete len:370 (-) Transcript_15746:1335-2444(-)
MEGSDIKVALQYSNSYGLPGFREWIRTRQALDHRPPYASDAEWNVCVTSGSQHGLHKAFSMLLDEGDTIFVEDPTYPGALASLRPLHVNIVGVSMDEDGMRADQLDRLLEVHRAHRPKCVYLIPTGQNPTGCTMSTERRRAILEVAHRHRILILEDDPYFNLYYGRSLSSESAEGFTIARRPQSFFELDQHHIVLRFDSLSKVLSSGLRLGWVTGPSFLVEKLQLHQQASCLHASGLSQGVALAILNQWGSAGWSEHVRLAAEFYRARRDLIVRLADKHLSGLVEYTVPAAGMFLWIRLTHVADSRALILQEAVSARVLMVPGALFQVNGQSPSSFVRASFSLATEAEMDTALQRVADLLRAHQQRCAQ